MTATETTVAGKATEPAVLDTSIFVTPVRGTAHEYLAEDFRNRKLKPATRRYNARLRDGFTAYAQRTDEPGHALHTLHAIGDLDEPAGWACNCGSGRTCIHQLIAAQLHRVADAPVPEPRRLAHEDHGREGFFARALTWLRSGILD